MTKHRRNSGDMGPWDDKPGAGRIAPVRRDPRFAPLPPRRTISFWAGVWVGLALGFGAAYGVLIWYLGRLL